MNTHEVCSPVLANGKLTRNAAGLPFKELGRIIDLDLGEVMGARRKGCEVTGSLVGTLPFDEELNFFFFYLSIHLADPQYLLTIPLGEQGLDSLLKSECHLNSTQN